ncbi:ATP-dependent Clp protease ATP-binding subunit, partial [bacterium]|nr:ATP-dependent Clp protease ATP-binding subunit [bacterium]
MGKNFSSRVQMVLQYAREEGVRLGHDYIGTEHLLLGLIREGEGYGVEILRNLGCELSELKKSIEDAVRATGETSLMGEVPMTKRTEKVLKMAQTEADKYKADITGTEHLLLSLARERDGVAAQVLLAYNINYDAIKEELENILRGMPSQTERGTKKRSKTPALDHFGRDLTEMAR